MDFSYLQASLDLELIVRQSILESLMESYEPFKRREFSTDCSGQRQKDIKQEDSTYFIGFELQSQMEGQCAKPCEQPLGARKPPLTDRQPIKG